MKRVLKPSGRLIIFESNPITTRGKVLILIENLFHTGAKFYEPFQLSKKLSEEHSLKVISVDSISIGYFLIASKRKDGQNNSIVRREEVEPIIDHQITSIRYIGSAGYLYS